MGVHRFTARQGPTNNGGFSGFFEVGCGVYRLDFVGK
jgi:hypothetical protein